MAETKQVVAFEDCFVEEKTLEELEAVMAHVVS